MRGQVRGVGEADLKDTCGFVAVICLPSQSQVDHGRQYNNQGVVTVGLRLLSF
jgi:hypothetical protein